MDPMLPNPSLSPPDSQLANATRLTIDGVGPMPVERPATVADLCAIVRRCADSGTAIYPVGGGTMLDYGMPPARPGIALAIAKLNQVIDYPARDMTITVQAGITMRELQETLAAENQWLPIDIPDDATIGGAIACDVSGPRRYGYGTLRDYVIGITVVNDRGEECKAGGRVVKNVAGYDLMKLYTGSLGTLGIITQVTLKVRPRPEAHGLRVLESPQSEIARAVDQFSRSKFRPVALTIENSDSACRITAQFDGSREAVDWQLRVFESEYGAVGRMSATSTKQVSHAGFRLHGSVLPSAVAGVCSAVLALDSTARIVAQPLTGDLIVSFAGCDSWSGDHAGKLLTACAAKAAESQGRMVVANCRTAWKSKLNVWGRPPADIALQKLIRAKFDSKRIFNPGRFVTDCF